MTPLAKNGSGQTDWQFYLNLVLPLIVTLLLAAIPALVGVGMVQSRLETDYQKRTRITQMQQPLIDTTNALQTRVTSLHNLLNQHSTTTGHTVMIERVSQINQLLQEVRRNISQLELTLAKQHNEKHHPVP